MTERNIYTPKELEMVEAKKAIGEINELLKGNLPTVCLLRKYEPQAEWFSKDTRKLHGVSHSTRVLVLQEV